MDNAERVRPTLRLVGEEGNAFGIMRRARKAAVKAGWSPCDWAAFKLEAEMATGGDYNNLMKLVMRDFDVI